MSKIKLATVWLDGCSGCHMSLLDLDEVILSLAQAADLVYGPLVDQTVFPSDVDVTLVEGAVSSQDDLKKLQTVRARTRVLVALGDCAVTSNVPSMRNTIPVPRLLESIYGGPGETPDAPRMAPPTSGVPALLPAARPVHDFVTVDVHLPGCPPSPKAILEVLSSCLDGRPARLAGVKFG
jgi:NAD-reducing hydrogenase small subunit